MNKEMTPLQALKKIKKARYFVDFELDAKVSEDYKKELDIIETSLKTNKKKLDVIGEILVDVSKGNYADLSVAIDEIRKVLL